MTKNDLVKRYEFLRPPAVGDDVRALRKAGAVAVDKGLADDALRTRLRL